MVTGIPRLRGLMVVVPDCWIKLGLALPIQSFDCATPRPFPQPQNSSYSQESHIYTAFGSGGSSGHGDTRLQCNEVHRSQEGCLPRASSHSSRAAISVLTVPMSSFILYTAIFRIMSSGYKLCNATRQMPMTFIPDSGESITPGLYLYPRSILR